MHIDKNEIPVKIDVPGAVARQLPDFGTASGTIGAEYFTLAAGTDLAPLLEGLDDDACHGPHWGYLIAGEVVVSYIDGTAETCSTGQLFHWPPRPQRPGRPRCRDHPLQPPGGAHRGDGPHPRQGRRALTTPGGGGEPHRQGRDRSPPRRRMTTMAAMAGGAVSRPIVAGGRSWSSNGVSGWRRRRPSTSRTGVERPPWR